MLHLAAALVTISESQSVTFFQNNAVHF